MRIRALVPLVAALVAAAPSLPAHAADTSIRTNYAVFNGMLKPSNGAFHADQCFEIDTSGTAGLTCEFSFAFTYGTLSCDLAGDVFTTARANYRSNLLGVTFMDIPLTGATVEGMPHLRGSIVHVGDDGVPTLLNIDVNLASLCTGERPKTFDGVVTYL
jgi:hypothetical protein